MNHTFLIILGLMSVIVGAFSCDNKDEKINMENNRMAGKKISLNIHSKIFTATLKDNPSAQAFENLLPLTINMIELNGNEKYYDLESSLPINPSNPGVIKNGDIMLYGHNSLVLFYKSLSTSYSYTKLATVDDVTDLAGALGSGNVTITFELK